ncbi:MAG: LacI family transcriptional regulator [Lachnospiraceae bacterium]|nr:LacI family transcriptional regulator [Lachnospiraceae bacterium]
MEEMRSTKLTIYDIAQELGISIATVSRALNGKEDVSEKTRERIFETAKRMGYKASKTAASLSRKEKKFAAIFPELIHDYDNEVRRGIEKAVQELQDYHVSVEMMTIKNNPEAFIEEIQTLANKEYDGILLIPCVGEAKLAEYLRQRDLGKLAIAAITTELAKDMRIFMVQSNGRVAGRMAGELLGTLLNPGKKVALVTGQMTSQVHQKTAEGFLEEIKVQKLDFVGTYEHYDQPSKAYIMAERLLKEHPDLDGIYLATANSVTFCNRLVEMGYAGKIKLVASDVFPKMIEFIKSGLVFATIFQNPFNQGRLATRYLFEYLVEGREFEEDEVLLEPQIVLKSNLELYEKKLLDVMSEDILF